MPVCGLICSLEVLLESGVFETAVTVARGSKQSLFHGVVKVAIHLLQECEL